VAFIKSHPTGINNKIFSTKVKKYDIIRIMKKYGIFMIFMLAFAGPAFAAPRTTTQPAQATKSNSVRAASTKKVSTMPTGSAKIKASFAPGIEGNPCKEEYWGCMDAFCMSDNISGARCSCSNDSIKLDKEYNAIVAEIEEEIGKTEDIQNEVAYGADVRRTKRTVIDFGEEEEEEEDEECGEDDIACKIGALKYTAAAKLCEEKVSEECKANFSFTKLQYSQNIRNDCSAYQTAIKEAKEKGATAAAAARKSMREAVAEQFEAKNKYNEGECVIELKKCMNADDICGKDWTRCTEENLAEKRFHCETKVLDNCEAVKENVWSGFAAEIRATLKSAVILAENDTRQNCLTTISDCVLNACKDNITGLGETMDGCLARPEMVQSFCKIQLDQCDETGSMWGFVKQKLAAMRVDACTEEVRQCFQGETACGADYTKCIGLDFAAMHEMCHVDKLVVCKQANPDFELADVDDMIMGLFMGMENQLQAKCYELLDEKIIEVCGETDTCDIPFKDDNSSHFSGAIKDWAAVPVSGGLDWKACKNRNPASSCAKFPQAGTIEVDNYVKNKGDESQSMRIDLESANTKINVVINMIENDQKIGWCIDGRNLGQINGSKQETLARFPTMTQGIRKIIAASALKAFSK
jgi:hypothetical protein